MRWRECPFWRILVRRRVCRRSLFPGVGASSKPAAVRGMIGTDHEHRRIGKDARAEVLSNLADGPFRYLGVGFGVR